MNDVRVEHQAAPTTRNDDPTSPKVADRSSGSRSSDESSCDSEMGLVDVRTILLGSLEAEGLCTRLLTVDAQGRV